MLTATRAPENPDRPHRAAWETDPEAWKATPARPEPVTRPVRADSERDAVEELIRQSQNIRL
jgi:hypothetical protein